ncbi:nucleolar protein 11 isoform X2 [Lycorma delicatula]|uniref:nucleolar protein 11 isoform X2 n=1 Tax=Lycorma delicatula TaxID=130591 RepID=UPI003F51419B
MARISSCYQLCPLIDQKSFFGVSSDSESGFVIVTLGKNMVIRYRLSDQKQVNSWNTKVRLSSPVLYDYRSGQYVGVFSMNTIRLWNETDVDLHKVKKYKFKTNIHCILSNGERNLPLVIVFKNGCVLPLTPTSLHNRKNIEAISDNVAIFDDKSGVIIEDVHLLELDGNAVVAFIISDSSDNELMCHLMPLQSNLFTSVRCSFKYRQYPSDMHPADSETNNNKKLIGYAFINGDTLKLLTLWSDGSLYCLELYLSTVQDMNSEFPGQEIMKISIINCGLKVAILPLDNIGCHIAVYGSDPSEEGALLAIVNIKHRLVQCKYDLKLYCTSPRLWSGGSTDLLLIIGRHLAVAHYRLVKQKLAALVGTQTDNILASSAVLSVNWQDQLHSSSNSSMLTNNDETDSIDTVVEFSKLNINAVKENICQLLNEGLSETGICERLLPIFIETKNTMSLIWLFNKLNDIPFHFVLETIKYCLKCIDNTTQMDEDNRLPLSLPLLDTNITSDPKVLLLSTLLTKVVPDIKTLSLIRQELSLSCSVSLVGYIIDLLTEYPGDVRLIEWANLLLDSHYQLYVISKDSNVIKTFKQLRSAVNNQGKQKNGLLMTIHQAACWLEKSRVDINLCLDSNSNQPQHLNLP